MCGVFGIFGHSEAAKLTYLGLHALQHRGQEAAGIVVSAAPHQTFAGHVEKGLVADVFSAAVLEGLAGDRGVGHVRYSTAGGSDVRNAQPILADTAYGPIAIAHNGNLTNARELRAELEHEGAIFGSKSDTEVVLHLFARARARRIQDRLRSALAQVEGAYTLILLHRGGLIGVRDPNGFRPLILGRVQGAHVLCSETCALELIGGEIVREIEPGEIVLIDEQGVHFERLVHAPDSPARACIFELVYFARPNSRIFGADIATAREELGRQLAREAPAEADLVIPVPDSGVPAAIGFAEEARLPFRHGLLRSHYVGRTFIEPEQSIRHFGVKLKLSAVRSLLEGRRVVVVDDSIVRGTTSRKLVKMLRAAGAREVHVRISSPPTAWPCFYGIDTPTRGELIAATHTHDEICRYLTADSLAYLSVEGLHRAAGSRAGEGRRFCDACFTGAYPVGIAEGALEATPRPPPALPSEGPPPNRLWPGAS